MVLNDDRTVCLINRQQTNYWDHEVKHASLGGVSLYNDNFPDTQFFSLHIGNFATSRHFLIVISYCTNMNAELMLIKKNEKDRLARNRM